MRLALGNGFVRQAALLGVTGLPSRVGIGTALCNLGGEGRGLRCNKVKCGQPTTKGEGPFVPSLQCVFKQKLSVVVPSYCKYIFHVFAHVCIQGTPRGTVCSWSQSHRQETCPWESDVPGLQLPAGRTREFSPFLMLTYTTKLQALLACRQVAHEPFVQASGRDMQQSCSQPSWLI